MKQSVRRVAVINSNSFEVGLNIEAKIESVFVDIFYYQFIMLLNIQ